MRNRIVEHPNRYKSIPVAGQPDTYDLIPVPGKVTDNGTPLDKANLLSDETAALYGFTGTDGTVDKAFEKLDAIVNFPYKYQAFLKPGIFKIPPYVSKIRVYACAAGGCPNAGEFIINQPFMVIPGGTISVTAVGAGNTIIEGQINKTLVAASVASGLNTASLGNEVGNIGVNGGNGVNSYGNVLRQGGYGGAYGYGGGGASYYNNNASGSGGEGGSSLHAAGGARDTEGGHNAGEIREHLPVKLELLLPDIFVAAGSGGKGGNGGANSKGTAGGVAEGGSQGYGGGGMAGGYGAGSGCGGNIKNGTNGFALFAWETF